MLSSVFSALRTFAIGGQQRFPALVVLILALVPAATNLVSNSVRRVAASFDHRVVSSTTLHSLVCLSFPCQSEAVQKIQKYKLLGPISGFISISSVNPAADKGFHDGKMCVMLPPTGHSVDRKSMQSSLSLVYARSLRMLWFCWLLGRVPTTSGEQRLALAIELVSRDYFAKMVWTFRLTDRLLWLFAKTISCQVHYTLRTATLQGIDVLVLTWLILVNPCRTLLIFNVLHLILSFTVVCLKCLSLMIPITHYLSSRSKNFLNLSMCTSYIV